MKIELRWTPSQSASCFYAAAMASRGISLTDQELAAAITEPAELLRREIQGAGLPEDRFWRHLVPLSAQIHSNRELAEVVLRKTIGTGPRVQAMAGRLAGLIGQAEAAVSRAAPQLVDEVATWAHLLQQQWELRGEGLLLRTAELTDPQLIASRAEVILVYPAIGGGGTANLLYNSVCIEAVQTDPHAELPELVRLAWMLSQLNIDLPMYSENIHADRRPLAAAAAMLPAVLAAAEDAELARFDRQTVQAALAAWHIDDPQGVDLAEIVEQWWETYVASRPPWSVALAALDRMVT